MLHDSTAALAAEPAARPATPTRARLGHNKPVYASLPHGAYAIMGGAFCATVLVYALTFGSTAEGAIAMAVSAFYTFMYLGTPYALARTGGEALRKRHGGERAPALREFLRGAIATASGPMEGRGALTQVVLVPIAMALASLGMCIAVMAAR